MIGFKAKLYAIGAAIVAALAFVVRMQYLKNKVSKLEIKKETLEAQALAHKVHRQIEKDRTKKVEQNRTIRQKQLQDQGHLDSLSNPQWKED